MIEVKSNLPDFTASIRAIRTDLQQKVIVAGTRAAANVFVKAARQNAPRLQKARKGRVAGMLARAMYTAKSRRVRGQGAVRFYVAVRGGSSRRVNRKSGAVTDAFYWRWQEAGWIPRGRGNKLKGGDRSKALARSRSQGRKVPGRWFIRDAFKSQTQPALDAFYARLGAAIARYNSQK